MQHAGGERVEVLTAVAAARGWLSSREGGSIVEEPGADRLHAAGEGVEVPTIAAALSTDPSSLNCRVGCSVVQAPHSVRLHRKTFSEPERHQTWIYGKKLAAKKM